MSLVPPEPDNDLTPIFRIETASGAMRTIMIAHRCGAGLGPENTCGAVVQSSFYRPDYYEIDIYHTSDGVAVCIHDETLDRTTNSSGNVSDFTFAEIQEADAGSWHGSTFMGEQIPSFEQIIDCVNPSPLAIELKEPDITPEQCAVLAGILDELNDKSSVVFSFHQTALESWLEVDESRRTCFLAYFMNEYALTGPHEIVGLLALACNENIVERIHEAGKAVWVWTVDENFEHYIEMGVDGIITNYPDRLREVLPPS